MPQKIKIYEEEFLILNNGKGDFIGSGSFSDKSSGFEGQSVGENFFKLYQRFHCNVQGASEYF